MSIKGVKQDYIISNKVEDYSNESLSISFDTFKKAINTSNEVLELDSMCENPSNLDNYNSMRDLFDKKFDVSDLPYYDDRHRYRFQGFTVTKDFIYITAHGGKNDPSVILVYDKEGNYLGQVKLPTGGGKNSHVGGISYDSEHDILYLTSTNGKVLVINNKYLANIFKDNSTRNDSPFNINLDDEEDFDLNSFVIDETSIDIKRDFDKYLKDHSIDSYNSNIQDDWFHEMLEDANVIENKASLNASSVYYDEINHKLYVPTFSRDSKIFVYDVSFDEEGNPIYTFKDIYGIGSSSDIKIDDVNLPYGIQGVATYTDPNGDTYLLMVSSFGTIDSTIAKYKIKEDGSLEFAGQHIFYGKKGLENIVVDPKTGDIFCNFENYAGGTDNDGGNFESIHVDDINGSNNDYRYLDIMRKMYGSSSDYER